MKSFIASPMPRSAGSIPCTSSDSVDNVTSIPDEVGRKAEVDAMWEQMNRGVSLKTPKSFTTKTSSKRGPERNSHSWMNHLGMDPKRTGGRQRTQPSLFENDTVNETAVAVAPGKQGQVEGKKGANEETVRGGGVDAILEQIKKKPKVSVLEKTKMDWGGYKEGNKGVEEELECYKKSSEQYLDKQSFLQRSDYREFERERDARLALQARRSAK